MHHRRHRRAPPTGKRSITNTMLRSNNSNRSRLMAPKSPLKKSQRTLPLKKMANLHNSNNHLTTVVTTIVITIVATGLKEESFTTVVMPVCLRTKGSHHSSSLTKAITPALITTTV